MSPNLLWPSYSSPADLAAIPGISGMRAAALPAAAELLRALIDDEFPAAEFNIEGYPTEEFIAAPTVFSNLRSSSARSRFFAFSCPNKTTAETIPANRLKTVMMSRIMN